MAYPGAKVIQILGGASTVEASLRTEARKAARSKKRSGVAPSGKAERELEGKRFLQLDPGELEWTRLIRAGLPAKSTKSLAGTLGMSITDLAVSLRLPARTVHRRLEKGEALTPEESERSLRAARVLAKAQDLLGDEHGKGWVLSPSRGLGGEAPITLLDTADGFTAVMDELGRLEYGVIG